MRIVPVTTAAIVTLLLGAGSLSAAERFKLPEAPKAVDTWEACDGYPRASSHPADFSKLRVSDFDYEKVSARIAACTAALDSTAGQPPLRRAYLLRARAAAHIIANKPADAEADLASARAAMIEAALPSTDTAELRHGLNMGRIIRALLDVKTPNSSAAIVEAFKETNPYDLPKLRHLIAAADVDPDLPDEEFYLYSHVRLIDPIASRSLIEALSWQGRYGQATSEWNSLLHRYAGAHAGYETANPAGYPYFYYPMLFRAEMLTGAVLDALRSVDPTHKALLMQWDQARLKQNGEGTKKLAASRGRINFLSFPAVMPMLADLTVRRAMIAAILAYEKSSYLQAQKQLIDSRACSILIARCYHPLQHHLAGLLLNKTYAGKEAAQLQKLVDDDTRENIIRRRFREQFRPDAIWNYVAGVARAPSGATTGLTIRSEELPTQDDHQLGASAKNLLLSPAWTGSVEPDVRTMASLLVAARAAKAQGNDRLSIVWATPPVDPVEPSWTDEPERHKEHVHRKSVAVSLKLSEVPANLRPAVESASMSADDIIARMPKDLLAE